MIFSYPVLLTILSVITYQVNSSDFSPDDLLDSAYFKPDDHLNLAKFISTGKPCLGVLIDDDIVLTSGSCAEGIRSGDMVTLKNQSPQGEKLPSYEVIAAIAHPKYTRWSERVKSKRRRSLSNLVGAKDFDLGIININIKNKKTPGLPIKLTRNNEYTKVGKYVMAITWHLEDIHEPSAGLSDYTDYEQKKVLDQGKCKIYGSTMKPNVTFCIGHHTFEDGLVEHELGAPIIHNDNGKVTLLGIYSEGHYENRIESPSKITKVAGLIRWIERVTKDREFFTRKAAKLIGEKYQVNGMKPRKGDKFAKVDKDGLLEMDIPEESI